MNILATMAEAFNCDVSPPSLPRTTSSTTVTASDTIFAPSSPLSRRRRRRVVDGIDDDTAVARKKSRRAIEIDIDKVGVIAPPELYDFRSTPPPPHSRLVSYGGPAAAASTQKENQTGPAWKPPIAITEEASVSTTIPPMVGQGDKYNSSETPLTKSEATVVHESDNDQIDEAGNNNAPAYDDQDPNMMTQQRMFVQCTFGQRNPRDEEARLMDRLDAKITRAEERQHMPRLDWSINRLEEEEQMRRLDENDDGGEQLGDVLVPLQQQLSTERDEEARLMDRLDAKITRAEERQLMQRLDWSINRLEEKELMRRLNEKIRDAENLERVRMGHSKVTDVIIVGEKYHKPTTTDISQWLTWEKPIRRQSQQANREDGDTMLLPWLKVGLDIGSPSSSDDESEKVDCVEDSRIATTRVPTVTSSSSTTPLSKVQNVVDLTMSCIKSRLPKWLPPVDDMASRSHSAKKDLLFTVDQFHSSVLKEFDQYFPRTHNRLWAASIVEDSSNSGLDDSYLLEARGPPDMLAKMKWKVQRFVRERVWDANLNRLLDDNDSFVIELDVGGPDLGLRCSSSTMFETRRARRHKGIWIRELLDGGEVSIALGNRAISKSGGCALLEVDGFQFENHRDFQRRMKDLKHNHSGNVVKVTLCFSKYTDLEGIHKSRNVKIRMMDGRPFSDDEYNRRKLAHMAKTIAKLPSQKKSSRVVDAAASSHNSTNDDSVGVESALNRNDDDDGGNDENHESGDSPRWTKVIVRNSIENERSKYPRNECYLHFQEKYKAVIALDYKATGMTNVSVGSSMWTQHKRLFGEKAVCDESCKCISSLHRLNLNVVGDYIEKKKRHRVEAKSVLRARTSGIFEHFAPRFIPLLQKKYPLETPSMLIRRLVDMWSLHQRTPMYGVHCTPTCACVDDWEQFFGEGDIGKALEFHSRGQAKNRRPSQQSISDTQMSSQPHYTAIPKKKDLLTHHTEKKPVILPIGKPPNDRLTPSSSSRHDVQNLGDAQSNSQKQSVGKSFVVRIDTSVPLGGYFQTEKKDTRGWSTCTVYSVFRNGQLAIDSRITVGSIVSAVLVRGNFRKLKNHHELCLHYEDAKRSRIKCLSLVFVNGGSKSSRPLDGDWDRNGNWVGSASDGWPGGAQTSPWEDNPGSDRTLAARHTRKDKTFSSPWQKAVSDAVENLSCKELHDVLQNTSDHDRESLIKMLGSQYNHVKNKIALMENASAHQAERYAKKQRKDLEAKLTILNIYIDAALIIETSISLSNWSKISIRVDQIDLQVDTMSEDFRGLSKVLNGTLISTHPNEIMGHLPTRTLAESVSYASDVEATFVLHNNLKLSQVERQLIIDAKVGHPQDGIGRKDVGLFIFPLDKIEKHCSYDRPWIDVSECVEPNSSERASIVRVSARKSKVDRDYIEATRKDAISALKSQIGFIEKFNQDPHHGCQLSANVRGIGGLSLLHAALQLSEDSALVEKLLEHGADPKAESTLGTPLTFAEKLLEGTRSKVTTHKENGGATSSRLAAYEARLAKAEVIHTILQLHESKQKKESVRAEKRKNVSFAD